MARAKQSAKRKQLEAAVEREARAAEQDARTGDVATVKQSDKQPAESLPTGTRRSHPPE